MIAIQILLNDDSSGKVSFANSFCFKAGKEEDGVRLKHLILLLIANTYWILNYLVLSQHCHCAVRYLVFS